jgi:hypothetical protein
VTPPRKTTTKLKIMLLSNQQYTHEFTGDRVIIEKSLTVLSFTCSSQMQSEAVNHVRQGILSFLLYLSAISSVCSGVVHRKAARSQLQHITGQLGHFNKTGIVYF